MRFGKDCDNNIQQIIPVRWLVRALVTMVLIGAGPVEVLAQTIRIHSSAVTDEPSIHLVDLATFQGFSESELKSLQDVVIAAAPAEGQDQTITIAQIRQALTQHSVNLARVCLQGASQCVVRRPLSIDNQPHDSHRVVKEDRSLRGVIRRLIAQKLAAGVDEVELGFNRSAEDLLELNEPEFHFELQPRGNWDLGVMNLNVTIQKTGQADQTKNLVVSVSLMKEVVIAAKTINRGQLIQAGDVRVEQRYFKRLDDIGETNPNAVIGQMASRVIDKDQMISTDDLKSVPMVNRNELVQVLAVSDGIVVMGNSARALESGSIGDVIEVRNESSKETFQVRITGLRQAEALLDADGYAPRSRLAGARS